MGTTTVPARVGDEVARTAGRVRREPLLGSAACALFIHASAAAA
jgi:hypothetical protein